MSTFWKIEEAVGGGRYIVLDGIFSTEEEAKLAISRHRSNEDMRAVLYETGHAAHGPTRWAEGYRR